MIEVSTTKLASQRSVNQCSPEPIYKISAPQGLVSWLGFLCTGMELAGRPLQNDCLLTSLISKSHPGWKMLIFGMNVTGKL